VYFVVFVRFHCFATPAVIDHRESQCDRGGRCLRRCRTSPCSTRQHLRAVIQEVTAPEMLASSECRYNKDDFLHAVRSSRRYSTGQRAAQAELFGAGADQGPRAHPSTGACRLEHVCCCCARSCLPVALLSESAVGPLVVACSVLCPVCAVFQQGLLVIAAEMGFCSAALGAWSPRFRP
jgi:hypothetical protein